jgi:hypothetical protein
MPELQLSLAVLAKSNLLNHYSTWSGLQGAGRRECWVSPAEVTSQWPSQSPVPSSPECLAICKCHCQCRKNHTLKNYLHIARNHLTSKNASFEMIWDNVAGDESLFLTRKLHSATKTTEEFYCCLPKKLRYSLWKSICQFSIPESKNPKAMFCWLGLSYCKTLSIIKGHRYSDFSQIHTDFHPCDCERGSGCLGLNSVPDASRCHLSLCSLKQSPANPGPHLLPTG